MRKYRYSEETEGEVIRQADIPKIFSEMQVL